MELSAASISTLPADTTPLATARMLCEVCRSIDFGRLFTPAGNGDWSEADHHDTSEALIAAAALGCELCKLFISGRNARRTFDPATPGPFKVRANSTYPPPKSALVGYSCSELCHWPKSKYPPDDYEHFNVLLVSGDCPNIMGRIPPKGPNFERWRTWVQDCVEHHESCPAAEDVQLPTRVLVVGTSAEDGYVSLIESRGRCGHYVTLSHVWGDQPSIVTTRDNYVQNCSGIPIRNLPPTFADAVVVTRELGFAYLWIDSLCIVQGDEAEWQIESAKMTSVYADSAVTIAAAAGSTPWAGLFDRKAASLQSHLDSVKIEYTNAPGTAPVTVFITEEIRATLLTESPQDYLPLYTRAWAVQDHLLCRRVLGFGKYGICYFQCDEAQCADHLRYSTYPQSAGFGSSGSRYQLGKQILECADPDRELAAKERWYAIVEEYSSCYLTEGRDKLPAISGIARILGNYIPGPYLAGLWQSDLIFGLIWTCKDLGTQNTRASLRPARFPAPSWSWAPSEKQVEWQWRHQYSERHLDIKRPCTTESARSLEHDEDEFRWIPGLDIDETDISPLDISNPYGEVKQATLTVSGKLRPIPVSASTGQGWMQSMAQAFSPARGRVFKTYFDALSASLSTLASYGRFLLLYIFLIISKSGV